MKNILFFKLLVFCVISAIILSSCGEDEIEVPRNDPEIAIASFFSQDSIKVYVFKSVYILAGYNTTEGDIYIDSAVVKFGDGLFIDTLERKEEIYYISTLPTMHKRSYYILKKFLQDNKEYSITVSSPGLKTAEATTTIPRKVEIIKTDTVPTIYTSMPYYFPNGIPYYICKITFKDPAHIKNYYYFEIRGVDIQAYNEGFKGKGTPKGFHCHDPIVEENIEWSDANKILFSDELIDGKEYSLEILISKETFEYDHVFLYLHSVSKDFYLHIKSYSQYDKAKEDEFSEPVLIYSNIQNGIGIFAGCSTSVDSLMGIKNIE